MNNKLAESNGVYAHIAQQSSFHWQQLDDRNFEKTDRIPNTLEVNNPLFSNLLIILLNIKIQFLIKTTKYTNSII